MVSVALGSVQWGLVYGIANRQGKPARDEVRKLLQAARAYGVFVLDTARAYGDAEEVIGELVGSDFSWQIITKLDPVADQQPQSESELRTAVRRSLDFSLRALRRPRVDGLLLHRAAQRTAHGGVVWDELLRLRRQGLVGALGVSCNSPSEAEQALADPTVEALQIATNLLDQRLLRAGFFERAASAGVRLFVRSVFLQGVAFIDPTLLPPHLAPLRPTLEVVRGWAEARGLTLPDAFLHFAALLPAVTLVLGAEQASQIEYSLRLLQSPTLAPDEVRKLGALVPPLADELLTPSLWGP